MQGLLKLTCFRHLQSILLPCYDLKKAESQEGFGTQKASQKGQRRRLLRDSKSDPERTDERTHWLTQQLFNKRRFEECLVQKNERGTKCKTGDAPDSSTDTRLSDSGILSR
jgi:hypothetical protein